MWMVIHGFKLLNSMSIVVFLEQRLRQSYCLTAKLWDFKSCVYDNASVNTGSISGVGARVEEERQKRWKAAGYTNPLTKMVTVGCSDHMVDLVSKSITLKITKDTKLDVNGFLPWMNFGEELFN